MAFIFFSGSNILFTVVRERRWRRLTDFYSYLDESTATDFAEMQNS